MTWGIRITVLYIGFVSLILSLVFISAHNKEELESKDYYKQELEYQDKIDAVKNANALSSPIDYKLFDKGLELSIPAELLNNGTKGEVYFLRPSDASKDIRFSFGPDADGKVSIRDNKIEKGVYKMKITVLSNNKKYIREEVVTF